MVNGVGPDTRTQEPEDDEGEIEGDRNEDNEEGDEDEDNMAYPPPLLIATVVAPRAEEARNARWAAIRLEGVGREFQRTWVRDRDRELERDRENNRGEQIMA